MRLSIPLAMVVASVSLCCSLVLLQHEKAEANSEVGNHPLSLREMWSTVGGSVLPDGAQCKRGPDICLRGDTPMCWIPPSSSSNGAEETFFNTDRSVLDEYTPEGTTVLSQWCRITKIYVNQYCSGALVPSTPSAPNPAITYEKFCVK